MATLTIILVSDAQTEGKVSVTPKSQLPRNNRKTYYNTYQADKLDLLAIFIISRCFAQIFKWASSGQCFLTTYNID